MGTNPQVRNLRFGFYLEKPIPPHILSVRYDIDVVDHQKFWRLKNDVQVGNVLAHAEYWAWGILWSFRRPSGCAQGVLR